MDPPHLPSPPHPPIPTPIFSDLLKVLISSQGLQFHRARFLVRTIDPFLKITTTDCQVKVLDICWGTTLKERGHGAHMGRAGLPSYTFSPFRKVGGLARAPAGNIGRHDAARKGGLLGP